MENNHCGEIVSLNISRKKGTIKTPQDQFVLTELGIDGDAHAGRWHRQISLLADESVKKFASQSDRDFLPGEFAENITTRGIDLLKVAVFDRFHIGDVLLEVTQLGKKCHGGGCAIYREVGKCVMPKEGIFCRVLKPGVIKPGDTIRYEKRPLTFKIITLSTRASLGEYEDRSGPHIKEKIVEAFEGKPWQVEFDTVLIGDDSKKLEQEIMTAVDRRVPFIFTTGGTGIGKSDITPDTLEPLLEKKLPGLMEYIRIKHGETIPNALLSRSVAGVVQDSLVYALPGSKRAVGEYMDEILKSLIHSLQMLRGIDSH